MRRVRPIPRGAPTPLEQGNLPLRPKMDCDVVTDRRIHLKTSRETTSCGRTGPRVVWRAVDLLQLRLPLQARQLLLLQPTALEIRLSRLEGSSGTGRRMGEPFLLFLICTLLSLS